MSENLPKIDASPEAKGLQKDLRADMPKNAQEFEVLLGRYKAQSPEKFEQKLKDGTLAKQAKTMGINWPPKQEPIKVVEKLEEPVGVETPVVEKSKAGRPKKSE